MERTIQNHTEALSAVLRKHNTILLYDLDVEREGGVWEFERVHRSVATPALLAASITAKSCHPVRTVYTYSAGVHVMTRITTVDLHIQCTSLTLQKQAPFGKCTILMPIYCKKVRCTLCVLGLWMVRSFPYRSNIGLQFIKAPPLGRQRWTKFDVFVKAFSDFK